MRPPGTGCGVAGEKPVALTRSSGSCSRQRSATCQLSTFPGSLMSVTSTSATWRLHQVRVSSPCSRGLRDTPPSQGFDDEYADQRVVLDEMYAHWQLLVG